LDEGKVNFVTVAERVSVRQCRVILNPVARSERAGTISLGVFPESLRVEVVMSRGAGHATELARKAAGEGIELIVAAGGDGTVNEVANGLAGSDSILGILPLGSVNVLVHELGIPKRLDRAWKVLAEGQVRQIDLGKVICGPPGARTTRYFTQLAGAGLDARAVQRVTRAQKKIWGPLSYIFAGLKVAAENNPPVRLEMDGRDPIEGACVIFGNGRFYGGPFAVLKHARIDDGWLDVCVFQRRSYWSLLNYLQGVLRRTHTSFKDVSYAKLQKARLTSSGEVTVQVDGEMLGFLPADVELIPRGLKVMVPH
jgi:diacylglycerol kinase (ATP)